MINKTIYKRGRHQGNHRSLSIILFNVLVCLPSVMSAQVTYTWDGSSSTLWTTAANWTPDRTIPATNDILVFNNGSTTIVDNVLTQTIGRLQITGSTNITLRPSTGTNSVLTVSAAASNALTVATGSTLTVSGRDAVTDRTLTLTTTNTAGLQANISGTLRVARDNNQQGATGSFTRGGTNAVINFNSGSVYEHAVNGGALPIASWNVASTCLITGITGTIPTASSFNQAFGNLTWNSAGQTVNAALGGNLSRVDGTFTLASTGATGYFRPQGNATYANYLQTGGNYRLAVLSTAYTITIPGNFTITGGTMNLSNTGTAGTLRIAGNCTISGGTVTELSTGSGLIEFNGIGSQLFTSGGTIANNVNIRVNSGSILQLGTGAVPAVISGSTGTFTLSSGASLGITSPEGISAAGATGNIQVTGIRTFNTGANYLYNGTGAQFTGSGLPTAAITGNVSVEPGSTVTATNPVIVNGTLNVGGTLIPGTSLLVIGGNGTLTGAGTVVVNRMAPAADFSSQYTILNKTLTNLTVKYSAPAGGQTISALTYGNLLLSNTSGTNTLAGNVTVGGTMTTSAGGTLTVGSNELTINNLNHSGIITISSTALDVNGSMIVHGNISQGAGSSISFSRQLRTETNYGDLHFFSSPVTANTEVNSGKITDVWLWNEVAGDWATTAITSLSGGRGYNLDQTSSSDGIITFTGSLVMSDLVVDVTSPYNDVIDGTEGNYDNRTFTDATGHSGVERSLSNYGGGGWNMLGNPFTSAMEVAAFIDANYSVIPADNNFDPNYVALYLYDGTTQTYYYVSNSTGWLGGTYLEEDYIQAGQGFFVLAMNDLSTFTFSRSMQGHDRNVPMLKSAKASGRWPGLQLTAKTAGESKRVTIVFNEEMSPGLDPGYDIGLMSSGSGIEIYASMPFDNGVNYTRQALPVAGADTIIIPVGVDFKKGGEVTFSAIIEPLNNYRFWLEDRVMGTFTNLNSGTYSVNIRPETYGTGRFYIHASVSSPTFVKPQSDDSGKDPRIWTSGNDVIIRGDIDENNSCIIYDLRGQKVIETCLTDGELNIIPMPMHARGLFIIRLVNNGRVTTQKVVFP